MVDQQRLINQVRRGLAKADTSRRNPYQKELIRPFSACEIYTSGGEKEMVLFRFLYKSATQTCKQDESFELGRVS